ncbi:hypothetical protein [Blastopirellula marina]|uniref:Uncharacterized protein n=1 Tax=Blastopirellula marina DSM 3645 TaxID=314230 RepID=A3ZRS1_9BACT|nr:hypothetical protein [Blastopirellula marina]EAQ80840.1 hypothetical protein DSM3645_12506 [Blastopirellula marina DSM 3645]
MPTEFTCQVCKQQIRVPDGNEGKRTKCPHCSAIQPIPGGPTSGGSSFSDSSNPYGGEPPPNPFAEGAAPSPTGEANPYASPYSASSAAPRPIAKEEAKGKIAVPAIVCMISFGLSIALLGLAIIGTFINLANGMQPPEEAVVSLITCGFYFLTCVVGLFMLYSTMNLRSSLQAWIGFILALTPCTNCCFIIGIPFAIWGMIVLSDAEVQRQFQN